jgi:hypothetical protein
MVNPANPWSLDAGVGPQTRCASDTCLRHAEVSTPKEGGADAVPEDGVTS